ncbi:MAG: CinA family protein [Candidatus Hodarchaeales archaeon]|jgi:PncC family amidohydrolase
MEKITESNYQKELENYVKKSPETIKSSVGSSYSLLHEFSRVIVIPLIRQKEITISTVELTTCGLITDLLTGYSGASHFFVLGMTPYSNEMKVKLGIPRKELSFGGYGVASPEAAKKLAQLIMNYSGSDIGLAETGLISSSELKARRTKKKLVKYMLLSLQKIE